VIAVPDVPLPDVALPAVRLHEEARMAW
jgi:hypothetical protein